MILFIDENGLWLSVRAGHLALRQRDGSYTWMPERIRTIVAVGKWILCNCRGVALLRKPPCRAFHFE